MNGDSVEDEDWARGLQASDGYPLVASLIGSGIAIAAMLLIPGRIAAAGQAAFLALGTGALIAAILWTVAYFATLRHASRGWRIGSFVMMWAVATLTGLLGIGQANRALIDDVRTFAEIRIDEYGGVTYPEGAAERGPISRVAIAAFDRLAAEQAEFRKRMDALGLAQLDDPAGLARDPALLDHCETVLGAKENMREADIAFRNWFAQTTGEIDRLDLPPDIRAELRDGFAEGYSAVPNEQRLTLQTSAIDSLFGMCRVLARRHWRPAGGRFLFESRRDLADYNAHVGALHSAMAQLDSIDMGERRRFGAQQAQMRRMLP